MLILAGLILLLGGLIGYLVARLGLEAAIINRLVTQGELKDNQILRLKKKVEEQERVRSKIDI